MFTARQEVQLAAQQILQSNTMAIDEPGTQAASARLAGVGQILDTFTHDQPNKRWSLKVDRVFATKATSTWTAVCKDVPCWLRNWATKTPVLSMASLHQHGRLQAKPCIAKQKRSVLCDSKPGAHDTCKCPVLLYRTDLQESTSVPQQAAWRSAP